MATQNEQFADDLSWFTCIVPMAIHAISMATLDHHRAYLGSTRLIEHVVCADLMIIDEGETPLLVSFFLDGA